jgi:UDP-4-amino-4,6-dideoxy-N-acetyl-beta-L-altrosamine transaminase
VIHYSRHSISKSDIDAVVDVLRSDFLTQGPVVPRFEEALSRLSGAHHTVVANSATAALHLACLALGLGPGGRLWTSPTTFVASANCALYCAADVDFVDIDPRTYNLSVACLADKLADAEKSGTLPNIVVPVHLCGQSCDMESIHALSVRYGFRIIEDASHAIGAQYQERPVGSCQWSDITVFSFHPVKIVTTGEGGAALTNNPHLADRMRMLRGHGITNRREQLQLRPDDEIWNYQQRELGFNYRMTDIQAALGLSQLERLTEFVEARRNVAKSYDQAFAELPLQTPWQHPDTRSCFHLYPIRLKLDYLKSSQKQIYDGLHRQGVLVNLHYIPVYRQPFYEARGFVAGYCPEAERYHREALSLPIYPTLETEKQGKVISTLRGLLAA